MQGTKVLIAPNTRVLNKLPVDVRRDINWYAEQGMPAQGHVVPAIRLVIKHRKESK